MINLHKHTCRGKDCEATANLLAYDGVCAYYLCPPCAARGEFHRHVRPCVGEVPRAAIAVRCSDHA